MTSPPSDRARAGGRVSPLTLAPFALIVWGTLAFGAVYPWAWWPLVVGCLVVGAAGLLEASTATVPPRVVVGLALMACAIGVQLLPVPATVLDASGRGAKVFLANTDIVHLAGRLAGLSSVLHLEPGLVEPTRAYHPLSVDPSATARGLCKFVALAVLLAATARWLGRLERRRLALLLLIFGAVVGLEGLIQQALGAARIYGLWQPMYSGATFASFVNRNHFAGWMLMIAPLSLGAVCSAMARTLPRDLTTWRQRALWLSTKNASQLLLMMFATAAMCLSVLSALSRSGIGCLALSLLCFAAIAWRQAAGASRWQVPTVVAVVTLIGIGFIGADRLVNRFLPERPEARDGRPAIWRQAARIAVDFPLVGSGLSTFESVVPRYAPEDLHFDATPAHNDYLQLAAEGGFLLSVPAALLIVILVSEILARLKEDAGRSGYWIRLGALAGIAAILLQESVEFSLQLPGNAVTFTLLCAIGISRRG